MVFLEETISDLNSLITNGFSREGKNYSVSVKYCVCDTPARNLVKQTKAFNGYWGCDYCIQKGEYNGRVILTKHNNLLPRTDSNFCSRNTVEGDEHRKVDVQSPFLNLLNFDMVKMFPLDYMHSTCLGVMKRLLTMWVFSCSTKKQCEIPNGAIIAVSNSQYFRSQMPSNFARQPRKLQEIERWKATEFRQSCYILGR